MSDRSEPRPEERGQEPRSSHCAAKPGARSWGALAALTLVSFLVLFEDTAVSVALPSIRRELGLGLSGLEWVVNAYTLSLAVFLLPGGKLADIHGRRRVFVTGVMIFAAASLVSGLAQEAWLLLAARGLQGLGAALTVPAGLAILTDQFPDRERGAALGLWVGGSAIGLGLGPLIGALLTDGLGWNWIFLVNVPLGVLAAILARVVIPESHAASTSRKIALVPLLLAGGGLLALLLALTEAPALGWTSPLIPALFATAAACFALFVRFDLRASAPLIDPALFRSRSFAGANAVSLLSTAVMCNLFFFLSLYFQLVLGYTALGAGAALLPLTALTIVVAPLAGLLSDRVGPRGPVVGGAALLGAALLLLSRIDPDVGITSTLVWLGLAGIGIGLTSTPTMAAALAAVPQASAGVGAGVVNVSRVVGLSLGIATMGAILSAGSADVLAGGGRTSDEFVSGLSTSLTVNAGIAVVAALVGAFTLKARRAANETVPSAPLAGPIDRTAYEPRT